MTHLFHPDRWLSGWKRTSFKRSCRRWWKAAGEGRLQHHGDAPQLATSKSLRPLGSRQRATRKKWNPLKNRPTHTHTHIHSVQEGRWCWWIFRRESTLCCQTKRPFAFCHRPSSHTFVSRPVWLRSDVCDQCEQHDHTEAHTHYSSTLLQYTFKVLVLYMSTFYVTLYFVLHYIGLTALVTHSSSASCPDETTSHTHTHTVCVCLCVCVSVCVCENPG